MKILIVEDEKDQRELIAKILSRETEHITLTAESAEKGLSLLKQFDDIDLIISDWQMPGKDGLKFLNEVKIGYPDISFILLTAYGSISHAVSSMRAGADDYLSKPFDKEQLIFAINKVLNNKELVAENKSLRQQQTEQSHLGEIIGSSQGMQIIYKKIEKISNTDITVLVHGESGTGKELIAKALHNNSSRKASTMLAVNCSAIPESLAEAELYGAEKGSFTGADQLKIGKIEAANRSTLFLDEVAELSLPIQAKLLRFLQEGTIMRVGSNQEIKVDVRVIAASHKDLATEVAEGRFREDLFYRLSIVPLQLPPLRQRLDDLPRLIEFFTNKYAKQYGINPIKWRKEVIQALYQHNWPGNIRELSNLIERLTVLNQNDEVTIDDLAFTTNATNKHDFSELPSEGFNWDEHEKSLLLTALAKTNNNRTKAAKLLGLNYKALLYRLDKHRIELPK
ncbi:MAG: sigma-54 dependent transcriptional regulator [Kangiellaceae bacterium]|jgi:two-component system NtrC family response regulator|nr:sigma-54 dependent transcriptional regulator [Kangiellaceae bacterium]